MYHTKCFLSVTGTISGHGVQAVNWPTTFSGAGSTYGAWLLTFCGLHLCPICSCSLTESATPSGPYFSVLTYLLYKFKKATQTIHHFIQNCSRCIEKYCLKHKKTSSASLPARLRGLCLLDRNYRLAQAMGVCLTATFLSPGNNVVQYSYLHPWWNFLRA